MRSLKLATNVALILVLGIGTAFAAAGQQDKPIPKAFQERTYRGKPITFWLQALRDRNDDLMSSAFEAIRSLDDDAWIAVPDLTRLVAAPFVAIHASTDTREVIASKLFDIVVRAEAIDTLAWIGEPAAPATSALVDWALTERIAAGPSRSSADRELFIELVAMDTEQRMRVAGAVSAFGPAASPIVAKLLTSYDTSKRKLAVAILSQDALPIATELLRSDACAERELGLLVIKDMGLVVEQSQIDELARQLRENCTMLSKLQAR
jgi:hypothetical protein